MAMKIDVSELEGVSVLRLEGELDHDAGLEVVAAASGVLIDRDSRAVLDLSDMPYITSAGISALVRVVAQANTQEQQVVFANPTPFVEGVFQTTRLNKFFAIYPGVEEALLALQA